MDAGIALQVSGLKASFGQGRKQHRVLEGVDLQAARGRISVAVGPSGAGKSTLINCIAGLHRPDAGEIRFSIDNGARLVTCNRSRALKATERRSIALCFQHSHLWSHMSVRENLVHPQVWLTKTPQAAAKARADELLDALSLGAFADSRVTDLSGGQRQRVAILRALSLRPEILLLDEVTASQDPSNVQKIFDLVKTYVSETGCAVLTISHDMHFVKRIADYIYLIEAGKIVHECESADLATATGSALARFVSAFSEEQAAASEPGARAPSVPPAEARRAG
jgi:ABC-type polar amino acid transport system ATPase subunit